MKKLFFSLVLVLSFCTSNAQRMKLNDVLGIYNASVNSFFNSDSLVYCVKIGVDTSNTDVEVQTIQIHRFSTKKAYEAFQDNLIALMRQQAAQAEEVRKAALRAKATAEEIRNDANTEKTKRPKSLIKQ